MKIPTKWQARWNEFAISHEDGIMAASWFKHIKTFSVFLNKLVQTWGACDEDCAAYLWNKMHPDKPRKVLPNA